MNEEKIKILKMIEEGKVTAEDGSKLLSSIEDSKDKISENRINGNAKWIRIKVLDSEKGKQTKVNIKIPISLVETGLKIGKNFNKDLESSMKDIDIQEILRMIKNGAEGKILEVETDNGKTVEIYVE